MSKTHKSASRSRSRSGSRSRSRSVSRSRSRSRSHSRSRKHRYGSRSRSRSRSHSPPHNNRERNYPREYQNNREFRGYHRGFRRPYYFRGRGRGFFPRGRFQRGGGGGYNNNYNRPNNWQNYRQHPQQQQQQQQPQQQQPPPHHPHSPRRGRSRSRTPKKRSGSPRSRSRSHHSERSSSRSRRSSSSSSSSSSRRRRSGSARRSSKDVKEDRSASKETQKGGGGGGGGGGNGEVAEPPRGLAEGEGASAGGDRASGNWQGQTDYSGSPKRASPHVRSAVILGQGAPPASGEPGAASKSAGASSNGTTSWQSAATAPSAKSPPKKSPTPVFTGFGFFSKEDNQAGDKSAISTAFKKFLEQHNNKKQLSEWENGRDAGANGGDVVQEKKGNGKSAGGIFDRVPGSGASKGADYNDKGEKEQYKHAESFEGKTSSGGFPKGPPFLCGEEEEDEEVKPRPKMREPEDEAPKRKGKGALSARELFERRLWDEMAYFQSPKDDDAEALEMALLRSQKRERAAAVAAAMAKREAAGMLRGFSPEKPSKARRKDKVALSPSPPAPPRRGPDNREREMFARDDTPPRASGKRGMELSVRMDSLSDDMASSSSVLAKERRLSRDLVHPVKKGQEFRSIFQHIQATQLRRSPSELFAQHIVTIVHHIKAQHFPSSGMTLNERFAMYQRRAAAEKEMVKPRKSPEIHRRIDVSPSAFKKHSHLFEEMKDSGDSSYKIEGKNMKGDSMDLRLDIERRKKHSRERDHKREGGRDSGDSPESSRERSSEKSSKHHSKSKKNKKRRGRSRSSSSSSSHSHSHRGGEYPQEEAEPKEEGFNKARLGPREYGGPMERGRPRGGFQFRIRGRGWNRGNYPGNDSNGNAPNTGMPIHPKNEDWDPEYTPKSRKYYLHDDRDGEGEKKWVDIRGRGRGNFLRGRGRFIVRRSTSNTSNSSPKWTHDKFQGSGEEGELPDEDPEQDHKEEDSAGVTAGSEQ